MFYCRFLRDGKVKKTIFFITNVYLDNVNWQGWISITEIFLTFLKYKGYQYLDFPNALISCAKGHFSKFFWPKASNEFPSQYELWIEMKNFLCAGHIVLTQSFPQAPTGTSLFFVAPVFLSLYFFFASRGDGFRTI